jgi:hypothetical protein
MHQEAYQTTGCNSSILVMNPDAHRPHVDLGFIFTSAFQSRQLAYAHHERRPVSGVPFN